MTLHRLALLALCAVCAACSGPPGSRTPSLAVVGKLGPGAQRENSGIVKSRRHPDVFWTQNDSGDEPRIYPVRRSGELHVSERYPRTPGVLIGGAINVDWEDIAVDASGHVIVGDFGNNRNDRRDLALYYLAEPDPRAGRAMVEKVVFFRYPDQREFPAPRDDFNFDAEAMFTVGDIVYILTKHRSDSFTKLYRLDEARAGETQVLRLLDRIDVGGKVVAADATPDGRRVAIATYTAVWLFEPEDPTRNPLRGRRSRLSFEAPQVEALCFADEETLLLADETTAALHEVKLGEFSPLP